MIAYEKHNTYGAYVWSLDLSPYFTTPEPGERINLMLAASVRHVPNTVSHSDVVFGFRDDTLVFVGKMDDLITPKACQALLSPSDTPIALGAVRVRALGLDPKRLREPQGQALAEQLLDAHRERCRQTRHLTHVAWRMEAKTGNAVAWQLLDYATTHASREEQAYLAAEPVTRWP